MQTNLNFPSQSERKQIRSYRILARRFQLPFLSILFLVGVMISVMGGQQAHAESLTALETKITASDGDVDDHFGHSGAVAISGDTVIVGSCNDDANGSNSGSAYVYVKNGSNWIEQDKLTASDGDADDRFGISVGISGDTVIVGAMSDEDGVGGSAYIFTRTGSTWTEQVKLTASDGEVGDRFGGSVAISGNTAIVGASLDDDDGYDSGSAYIFIRSGNVWTEQDKITAIGASAGDNFGQSVGISGDTVIVGLPKNQSSEGIYASAFIFTRTGSTWNYQYKLAYPLVQGDYGFGWSVGVSGDKAIVGAWGSDDNGNASGSAYIYTRTGSLWNTRVKLTASDISPEDNFGYSVAISGDTAIVGSYRDDDDGFQSGSAYVFSWTGSSWTEQSKIVASDAAADDRFGTSVAISGNTVIVGSPNDDDGGNDSGSAYIYEFDIADTTAPSSSIAQPSSPTNQTSFNDVAVTFNEDVTGLEPTDFSTSGLIVSNLQGAGSVYTIDLAITGGAGTKTIQLPADRVVDASGNGNTASNLVSIEYLNTPEIDLSLPGGVPLTLVRIPAGTFQMGSPASETAHEDIELLHSVTLTRDFYMGKYEVTQAQWLALMGSWPGDAPTVEAGLGDDYPAYNLSWDDLQGFLTELQSHLDSTGQEHIRVRLPSEAEWEYACRATTTTRFSYGDGLGADDVCSATPERVANMWYCGNNNPPGAKQVGQLPVNAFGLYDMHGNVSEWVQDWFGDYPSGSITDPEGPVDGGLKVIRGGAWSGDAAGCRSASRGRTGSNARFISFGFRVAGWDPNSIAPEPPANITYPQSSSTGRYTVSWDPSPGATSYMLDRSSDGGTTWLGMTITSSTSYSEEASDGDYRYRVRAGNSHGDSEYLLGDHDCLVRIPDTTRPSVTIASVSSPTLETIIESVQVAFSEPVTGLEVNDFITSGIDVSDLQGSGASYTIDLTLTGGPGTKTIQLPSNSVTDTAGNGNTASNTVTVELQELDTTPPTVTIVSVSSPTTETFFDDVAVTFSEDVTGLEVTDFTTSGINVSDLQGSGSSYTIDLTLTGGPGTKTIQLPADSVVDGADNGNTASNTVTVELQDPVTSQPEVTGITAIQRLGEPDYVDITYTLSGASVPITVSVEVTLDGGVTWEALTTATGDIGGGIDNGARSIVWDAGTDAPDVELEQAQVRLFISNGVTEVSLDASNWMAGCDGADNSISNPTSDLLRLVLTGTRAIGRGTPRDNFQLSPRTGTVDVRMKWQIHSPSGYTALDPLCIADESCVVLTGVYKLSTNNSWSDSVVVQSDTWCYSSISIDPDGNGTANTAYGNYLDQGGTELTSDNISVGDHESELANARIKIGFGDNEASSVYVDVEELTITGGQALGGVSNLFSLDTTSPTATIASIPSPTTETFLDDVAVTFSEDVTGLEVTDFTTSGIDVSDLQGSGSSYTIDLTLTGGSGTKTIQLPAGSVIDEVGNGNTASNTVSVLLLDQASMHIALDLGRDVSIDGDTLIAGAPKTVVGELGAVGTARVYRSDGAGSWMFEAELIANDAEDGDRFGQRVFISGDTAMVSADWDDDSAGSVYVFTRSNGIWTQQQKLTASDRTSGRNYGCSISIDGDRAVIGSFDHDNGGHNGSAYVYTNVEGVWTDEKILTPSSDAANRFFGCDVAISGDTVVVGKFDDYAPSPGSGSAYVFTRSGNIWTQQQKLTSPDPNSTGYFGTSVAIDLDTIIIGEFGDSQVATQSGSACIFTRTDNTWSFQKKLVASDAAPSRFGNTVALLGDTALVGAYRDRETGSAYVFTGSGDTWTEQQKLVAGDLAADDYFGESVDMLDDVIVVGAPWNDAAGENAGAVYLFEFSDNEWREGEVINDEEDVTSPTVTIASVSSPTTESFFDDVAVTFSENVTGLELTDFTTSGIDVSDLQGSGSSYTIDLTLTGGSGTKTIQLPADSASDAAGNGNLASNLVTVDYTELDEESPTVVLQEMPVPAEQTFYTFLSVTFSEPITGLSLDDFLVDGLSLSNLQGTGADYTMDVHLTVQPGGKTIELPAGAVTDLSGNPNLASNRVRTWLARPDLVYLPLDWIASEPMHNCDGPTDGVTEWYNISFDDSGWESVILPDMNSIPVNMDRFYRTTFEAVDGFPHQLVFNSDDGIRVFLNGELLIEETNGCYTEGCVNPILFCGEWITVPPVDMGSLLVSGENFLAVHVSNGFLDSYFWAEVGVGDDSSDTTPPSVILEDLPSPTATTSFTEVPVTFSEEVTPLRLADFWAPDVELSNLQGSGANYTIDVLLPDVLGTYTIELLPGACADMAGNPSLASNIVTIELVDPSQISPVVTIAQPSSPTRETFFDNIAVSFSETVTGLEITDFLTSEILVSDLQGSGADYTIDLELTGNAGMKTVQLPSGAVTDGDGNGNLASDVIGVMYVECLDADLAAILNQLLNGNETDDAHDVNSDGSVDAADVALAAGFGTGIIEIDVTPDEGSWTLEGPEGFITLNGTGDRLGVEAITCAPAGTYQLICSDSIPDFDPPETQSLELLSGGTIRFEANWTPEAVTTGDVTVTILPAAAVTDGAQWRVVSRSVWRESGETETALPTGIQNIEFKDVTGWVTPNNEEVTIVSGETAAVTGQYVLIAPTATEATEITTSSFRANWNALTGVTEYRLDVSTSSSFESFLPGFEDQNVGNVTHYDVTGLSENTPYYYRLRAVSGAGTSGNSNVIEVTTEVATGSLTVTITPGDAILAGAQWRRVGTTTWNNNETTESGLTGEVTIEFRRIPQWIAPQNRNVPIRNGINTSIRAHYEMLEGVSDGVFGLGTLQSSAYSPTGTRILSVGARGVILWDSSTGDVIRTFEGQKGIVYEAAFSSDGSQIIAGGEDKVARLWNTESGALIRSFEGNESLISSVAISNDGSQVFTGGYNGFAHLWNTSTGAIIYTLDTGNSHTQEVDFSPDGSTLMTANWDGSIKLWRLDDGSLIRRIPTDVTICSAAYSTDGAWILTGNYGHTATLWDTVTGQKTRIFNGHSDQVWSVAFSPDGTKILTGSGGIFDPTVRLWDVLTGEALQTFGQHHIGTVHSVGFSPDSQKVLTSSLLTTSSTAEPVLRLYDAATSDLTMTFNGHTPSLLCVAISPDGTLGITSSSSMAWLWDLQSGVLLRTIEDSGGAVTFTPDGKHFLTAAGQTPRLYDLNTDDYVGFFEGHSSTVHSVAFSPDGSLLVTGGEDNTVRIWDVETELLLRSFEDNTFVHSVSFSADGSLVLAGGGDWFNGWAKVWDPSSGELIGDISDDGTVTAVDVSPDGSKILTATARRNEFSQVGRKVRVWDLNTGDIQRTFELEYSVEEACFSPDGSSILAGAGNDVWFWNTNTGNLIQKFEGHSMPINHVVYSDDGAFIMSAGKDGTARLWNLNP